LVEKFIKILLFLFSPFGCWGFVILVLEIFSNSFLKSPEFICFLSGGVLFLIFWIFYFSRRDNFWSILQHELTHAFFALFFFKKVHTISASRQKGGKISIERGNFVIALAPYFFPLISILFGIIKLLMYPQYTLLFNFMIGFSFIFFILNMFSTLHLNQTDIRDSGIIFSIVFIIFFNIFFLGLILYVIKGDFSTVIGYITGGLNESISAIKYVYYYFLTFKF
jgi:hypothetical protein